MGFANDLFDDGDAGLDECLVPFSEVREYFEAFSLWEPVDDARRVMFRSAAVTAPAAAKKGTV